MTAMPLHSKTATPAEIEFMDRDREYVGVLCRTKGIPMRADVVVDSDGFHVFDVNLAGQDEFAILDRLIAACDRA